MTFDAVVEMSCWNMLKNVTVDTKCYGKSSDIRDSFHRNR